MNRMNRTVAKVAMLIAFSKFAWAEDQAPVISIDKEKVSALVQKLGSEEFEVREQATEELKKLGPELAPLLAELEKNITDAEVLQRIRLVKDEHTLAHVKTLEDALRVRKFHVAKAAASGGTDEAQLEKAAKALELVVKFAKEQDRDKLLAELHFEAGMAYYRKYQQGAKADQPLKWAAMELEKSVDLYDKQLKADPQDKATEDRQLEANMVLYACRKYITF